MEGKDIIEIGNNNNEEIKGYEDIEHKYENTKLVFEDNMEFANYTLNNGLLIIKNNSIIWKKQEEDITIYILFKEIAFFAPIYDQDKYKNSIYMQIEGNASRRVRETLNKEGMLEKGEESAEEEEEYMQLYILGESEWSVAFTTEIYNQINHSNLLNPPSDDDTNEQDELYCGSNSDRGEGMNSDSGLELGLEGNKEPEAEYIGEKGDEEEEEEAKILEEYNQALGAKKKTN